MKIIKELIPYAIIILVVVIIRCYIVTPVIVNGASMEPTLNDKQVLLLKKFSNNYKRFDIVVIDFDDGTFKSRLIKRVIGLPGEKIEYNNRKLYVNGKEVKDDLANITGDFTSKGIGSEFVPDDCYLVLGDNRTNSTDSRVLGFIKKDDIKGSTSFRLFPFTKFGKID
ncbi:MAG TPA: signal peptidase I [Bacilli bacterium]|nr:signal peptidase I [Bacilli bacterium]